MSDVNSGLLGMIGECKNERDIDRRIELLYKINSLLPEAHQLRIPSLVTNGYVNFALYKIEEKLLVA